VSCDHRIKGYAYCQDCIVLGVQQLSGNRFHTESSSKASIAALLGIIPGMGAVYNRQNLKAAVHFAAVVGTFQLTHLHVLSGVFALAGAALYIYTILDAFRTSQAIAAGESARSNEEKFKRSLVKVAPYVGLFLVMIGVLSVIQMIHPFPLIAVARLLPVALILLGGFLLTRYFKKSREQYDPEDTDQYVLAQHPFGRSSGSNAKLAGRRR